MAAKAANTLKGFGPLIDAPPVSFRFLTPRQQTQIADLPSPAPRDRCILRKNAQCPWCWLTNVADDGDAFSIARRIS
jgi:hypothetical protein